MDRPIYDLRILDSFVYVLLNDSLHQYDIQIDKTIFVLEGVDGEGRKMEMLGKNIILLHSVTPTFYYYIYRYVVEKRYKNLNLSQECYESYYLENNFCYKN